jgi:putative zinc finger/helix-turn-helix YgiT family protein
MIGESELCPNCQVPARVAYSRRTVPVGSREVEIDDEYTCCDTCNEQFYTLAQATESHRRAIAAVRLEDGLLAPERIRLIRESLGLTQRQFEELLGVGEKTCVRWESGRVSQNVSTDRLIRLLAANRANAQLLAGINGVALPDSCYVPEARQEVDFFDLTPAALDHMSHQIVIGGTAEVRSGSRDEVRAVREAAVAVMKMHSVAGATMTRANPGGMLVGESLATWRQ